MKTTVREIMTNRVIWVRQDASYREMAAALRRHRISAFPVLGDADQVIGIVSEGDLLTKEALDCEPGAVDGLRHRRDARKARGVTAGDLMTAEVVTVAPEDTVERAALLMYAHKVKRLPVVDAEGHLVGIVSRADVLSVFDRPDGHIRREIRDEVITGELLNDPQRVDIEVRDGVVTLTGDPETNEIGHQIVRQVRHVEGVVAVRDHLNYRRHERNIGRFDVLARFPVD